MASARPPGALLLARPFSQGYAESSTDTGVRVVASVWSRPRPRSTYNDAANSGLDGELQSMWRTNLDVPPCVCVASADPGSPDVRSRGGDVPLWGDPVHPPT